MRASGYRTSSGEHRPFGRIIPSRFTVSRESARTCAGGVHRRVRYGGTARFPVLALSWCAAHARAPELDRMLADGIEPGALADPVSRRRCQARARLLTRQSFRRTLAAQIEEVLALVADSSALSTVWAVDVQLEQLREARASLRLIVGRLEESTPPRAQGVALAVLLLRDGRSPLYGGLRSRCAEARYRGDRARAHGSGQLGSRFRVCWRRQARGGVLLVARGCSGAPERDSKTSRERHTALWREQLIVYDPSR